MFVCIFIRKMLNNRTAIEAASHVTSKDFLWSVGLKYDCLQASKKKYGSKLHFFLESCIRREPQRTSLKLIQDCCKLDVAKNFHSVE